MTETAKPYEVTTHEPAADSPAALMMAAVKSGMDLDKLEKMMALQERYEANEARKAYTAAMSDFKKNPPEIEKDRHVEYKTDKGTTKYNHASLGNVTAKINSALGEHGLSAAWETEQTDKGIKVTCKITHILGHSESTSLSAASDQTGGKNAIQALGSTISYLERYTLLALTGLATHEMDSDGVTEPEYISEKQVFTICDMLSEKGINETRLLKYLKAESIEKILAGDFSKAIQAIKDTKPPAKKEDQSCPQS